MLLFPIRETSVSTPPPGPSLTGQVIIDTWIDKFNPTTPHGTDYFLAVNHEWSTQSLSARRTYVKVNTTNLTGSNATSELCLNYWYDYMTPGGEVNISLYHVDNNAWLESITWNTQPCSDPINSSCQYISNLVHTSGGYSWVCYNITGTITQNTESYLLNNPDEYLVDDTVFYYARENGADIPYIKVTT